jgi:hypothetical protein
MHWSGVVAALALGLVSCSGDSKSRGSNGGESGDGEGGSASHGGASGTSSGGSSTSGSGALGGVVGVGGDAAGADAGSGGGNAAAGSGSGGDAGTSQGGDGGGGGAGGGSAGMPGGSGGVGANPYGACTDATDCPLAQSSCHATFACEPQCKPAGTQERCPAAPPGGNAVPLCAGGGCRLDCSALNATCPTGMRCTNNGFCTTNPP